MYIYITDKEETRTISLREWDNKADSWANGGTDIFQDLETNVPRDFPVGDYDTDADAAMTDADYREVVEWWKAECEKYNQRENSWFTEYSDIDAEFAKAHEMIFNAD